MLRIAAVLLLVACGGSKPAPAPISNTPPPPTRARAAEPEPAPIDVAIARAGQFRDMICACRDRACGDKVDEAMARWGAARQDEGPLTWDQKRMMTELILEYAACYRKLQDMP